MKNNIFDRKTEELEEKLKSSSSYQPSGYRKAEINPIIKQFVARSGYSNKELASKLSVSESQISKMISGERINRNNLLKLAIVANFTREETDQCLAYLKLAKLYAKDQSDHIVIYALLNNLTLSEVDKLFTENDISKL